MDRANCRKFFPERRNTAVILRKAINERQARMASKRSRFGEIAHRHHYIGTSGQQAGNNFDAYIASPATNYNSPASQVMRYPHNSPALYSTSYIPGDAFSTNGRMISR